VRIVFVVANMLSEKMAEAAFDGAAHLRDRLHIDMDAGKAAAY
jgi:hypothetical protein